MTALDAYASRGHHRVEGWLTDLDAHLIASLARLHVSNAITGPVAEIGVHHGRLFILLCLLTREDERALAIDLFEDQASNIDGSGAGSRVHLQRNLARHLDRTDNVTMLAADSTTLAAERIIEAAGGPCRIISIDGGHTAEITESDLKLCAAAVADGGIVILDDYFNRGWPGVSEGTIRAAPAIRPRLVPFAIGENKVLFCGADHHHDYRSFVTRTFTDDRHRVEEKVMLDWPVAAVFGLTPQQRVKVGLRPLIDTRIGMRVKQAARARR